MSVLITGAAGFIGSATARALLARGDSVLGIDNLNSYYDPSLKQARLDGLSRDFGDRFHFERLDFSDAEALGKLSRKSEFDRIVHLGAQAGVRYSLENPAAYFQSNLVGHGNMIELARQRRSSHFVYASSSSVYGSNKSLPFRVEDRVDHPLSLYAASKKANELVSESYANIHGLPSTGLRFFTVYGPWGRPDMAMWIFLKALMEDRELPVFNGGDMRRDFTYIDDIVAGVLAALDRPPPADAEEPHRLYNLGNDRPESVNALVTAIEAACGRKAERIDKPMPLGDVPKTWADISASCRELGYAPTTKLDEGIRRFVAWYRDYAKT